MSDHSGVLRDMLSRQVRGLLVVNTSKTALKVDSKNSITGEVFIETSSNSFSKESWAFLQGFGFRRSGDVFFLKVPSRGSVI